MTIGIVTFFKSYNYGVWLQAIATQQFFLKNGYKAHIINYTNVLEDSKTQYAYKEHDKFYGYVTSFIKSILFGKVKYYKRGFAQYLDNYYVLSPQKYHDIEDMQNIEYDVLVAGSDQLWNPETTSGILDKVFLLQFGKAKKHISIATSIGSTPIDSENGKIISEALESFDAISVREQYAVNELHRFCDFPIKVIMDPTFLLDKNDWIEIAQTNRNISIDSHAKYILTYFISTDKRSERYQKIVENYSKKFNLPVWAIQFSCAPSTPCDKIIVGASISDFINLIVDAALIITDSFHGVALSLNLNANFIAVTNKSNPERVRFLLEQVALSDRIEKRPENYTPIDYSIVNEKLNLLKYNSQAWILTAINR